MAILRNLACRKVGYCLPTCGMCELKEEDNRKIKTTSLFGECRSVGRCIDGICNGAAINRKKKCIECNREIKDDSDYQKIKGVWESFCSHECLVYRNERLNRSATINE